MVTCDAGDMGACAACFETFNNGDASTWAAAPALANVACPSDENTNPLPNCPGILRRDALGEACRGFWLAQANRAAYKEKSTAYCEDNPTALACRCLKPQPTSTYDGTTFAEVQEFVSDGGLPNPQGGRCYWGGCNPSDSILQDYDLSSPSSTSASSSAAKGACPGNVTLHCANEVKNITISIDKVRSGNFNIVKQSCGSSSGSGTGSSSTGSTKTKDAIPHEHKLILLAGIIAAAVLLVGSWFFVTSRAAAHTKAVAAALREQLLSQAPGVQYMVRR